MKTKKKECITDKLISKATKRLTGKTKDEIYFELFGIEV